MILFLNNSTNFSSFKFSPRLFFANCLRLVEFSKMPPMPLSFEYMKEIMAVRMVRMFQEELHVYL